MNIIFGDSRDSLPNNYTVLELDRFRFAGKDETVTAFCIVENIPLGDFPVLDAYIKVHHDLIEQYRLQNWEFCISAIKGLRGKWNGELDSFYDNLLDRVENFIQTPPAADWDGTIRKSI